MDLQHSELKTINNALPGFSPHPQLTERENGVLRWMVEGKRNSEIAAILGLSARTVENHVQSILRKLLVENRATAIVRAMEYCAAAAKHSFPSGDTGR